MPDPRFPFVRPDDLIETMTAGQYNARNEEIERRSRLSVGGGLRSSAGPGGRSISMSRPDAFWARLGGSANPYAFEQVALQSDGTWATVVGGFSGDGTPGGVRAYEVNSVNGLHGKVAWLTPGYPGDYRFQHVAAGGGYTPPISITVPGCFCTAIPVSLSLTVAYGPGVSAATYGHRYQDCTLQYYDNAAYGLPPYMPGSSFPGPGWYSTTAWTDDFGFLDYLRLSCFSNQFAIGSGQYGGGLWYSPEQIFNWNIGSRTAPFNTCSPFLLSLGATQPGVGFSGQFIISG